MGAEDCLFSKIDIFFVLFCVINFVFYKLLQFHQ